MRTRRFGLRRKARRESSVDEQQPRLGIAVSAHGERTRIVLAGELDLATTPLFSRAIVAVEQQGPELIEIDIRGLTFMDSSGLGRLFAANRRAREVGRRLVLLKADGPIDRVLELARVEDVIDTVEEPLRRGG
ncbi:MAG TPA: STAS domain-containing protein [Thermoleophilaceae bacterium]|jgi:anti-anti-sigma factor